MGKNEMSMEDFYSMADASKNRVIDKIINALKKDQKAMRVRYLSLKLGIGNVGMVSNVIKQHTGKELLKKKIGKEVWVGLNPDYKPKNSV